MTHPLHPPPNPFRFATWTFDHGGGGKSNVHGLPTYAFSVGVLRKNGMIEVLSVIASIASEAWRSVRLPCALFCRVVHSTKLVLTSIICNFLSFTPAYHDKIKAP